MPGFIRTAFEEGNRGAAVCAAYGHRDDQNPKVVAGSAVASLGRVPSRRRAIILALLLTAAGPAPSGSNVFSMSTNSIPSPAPASTATLFTPAPTPNQDLLAPAPFSINKGEASLGPSVFQPKKNQVQGEGYVPGSTVQGEQERRLHITPGINLRVPLN